MAVASRRAYLLALTLVAVGLLLGTVAGVAWAETTRCEASSRWWCEGTKQNDTMYGDAGFNAMRGLAGNDVLKGGDEGDWLYGNQGRDRLYGQSGGDEMVGGPGDDKINGGTGDDWYPKYNDGGWGHDTLADAAGTDELYFADGWTSADLTINLNAQAKPNVRSANRTSTIEWEGEVIEIATSGSGDDNIIGNDSDNVLSNGDGGVDTISGRGGTDTIYAYSGDEVDCGEGDDTLIYWNKRKPVPQNVNCETVAPYE